MLRRLACACALTFVLSAQAQAADWSLGDVMPISARSVDRVAPGRNVANLNRLGFFSDLKYDAATGTWFALSDRGPGGGVIGYATRVQQMIVPLHPVTGAVLAKPVVLRTILFQDRNGRPFNGLNPTLLNGTPATLGNSFDPEGIAVGRNGRLYVSDEYGPSLYEFDRRGRFVRAFEIPANLRPVQADGQPNYTDGRGVIATGRQDNRGFEGLTFNASRTRLYAVLQDPLVNEGEKNDGRRSRWVRVVEFDPASGTSTAQYLYPLESVDALNAVDPATGDDFEGKDQGRSIGLSAIEAISDHEFLVLERDNRGLGVEETAAPVHKRVYRIDLRGATDVQHLSLAGRNDLPAGVRPVAKRPEVDLLAALRGVGSDVPEKLEGLAIGPRLLFGGQVVLVGSDNDYSVTQSGAGEQFDVCVNTATGERRQVPLDSACPAGTSLIPGYLLSFKVRGLRG
ncbi:esterase-like activity of phytase family protein [Luteimonas aquatica]|uniref:esterase-like activity of phytase family protein n=1 Tax=Luteimonas aquatica TaxID=450364 RepID=UPI001F5A59C3|nr:esterase-like activity of phytase family protein [Luteimonas aquatica]